ncbi:hypothetical protein, partial [Roseibium sediminis]|uniref:hypothetical protein n=1 Tax=Roseibium sediminis TaxID=1775174 RepID=UPI0013754437
AAPKRPSQNHWVFAGVQLQRILNSRTAKYEMDVSQGFGLLVNCSIAGRSLIGANCRSIDIATKKVEKLQSKLEFIPIFEISAMSLNFRIQFGHDESMAQMFEIANRRISRVLAKSCAAETLYFDSEKLMVFLIREDADAEICVKKSILYFLGFVDVSEDNSVVVIDEALRKIGN